MANTPSEDRFMLNNLLVAPLSAIQVTPNWAKVNNDVSSHQIKLKTSGVNLFYGHFLALRNVTIDIPAKAITAIIGPSGCGKSSLLRLFNRMNDLIAKARLEGKVELEGVSIYEDNIDVVELRRRVGMVFQKPNPFPMSVFDNVAFGPRRHGKTDKALLNELVESSLRQAALWDEVKDKRTN